MGKKAKPTPPDPATKTSKGAVYKDWDSLKSLSQNLKKQRAKLKQKQLAERKQAEKAAAEQNLFSRAVGKVHEIAQKNIAQNTSNSQSKPQPIPLQTLQDQKAVLRESLHPSEDGNHPISDDFEVAALLSGNEQFGYAQEHITAPILQKLRQGKWRIQAQLDLHHLQSDAAREQVTAFIKKSHQLGLRCVRVIHGKGYGSEGGVPVLKNKVPRWLAQHKQVLAFVQAREADGGAGAVVVLLDTAKKKNHY